jgi:uncharacterized membrane protein
MIESPKTLGIKRFFFLILAFLVATNLAILLNIPLLRQILGFLFLAILPGLLILQVLKLNKIGLTEKFVLSVGLSISFLLFFGLSINNISLALGCETPLATISLLVSFNLAFIVLAIAGYVTNNKPIFSLPNINLSTSEKAFLIVPILFPALSIFGMNLMNTTDNNIILMLLLFLIPIYVIFVCFFNHKFPKRLYPVVIFLISISLILLLPLRSNHIIGVDTHAEYYFFRTTMDNFHWSVFGHSTLDACLAISLLPTIYQFILNIPSEFLYKILYSLIYSVSPLVIYVISKRYIGDSYAFLASCFYMFQSNFLFTASNARANIAMFFFVFAMMALFSDKIDPLKKRILFIVFMASCMVSHYSTTYIFFFVMAGTFIGIEILSKKYTFKKVVSLTIVILFFSMIFFWYSQVTETAFNDGVRFVEDTLSSLNRFFVEESRSGSAQALLGKDIMEKGIPHKIEFMFTWLTFAFIGIGIITLIRRYKEMSFPELEFKKPEFLKDKFEVGYFVIALACSGLLAAVVAVPYISVGYGLDRMYPLAITILSVFFVIGGIMLSKHFLSKERTCAKKETLFAKQKAFTKNNSFFSQAFFLRKVVGKAFLSKKRFVLKEKQKSSTKSTSEVRAYLIILLVLIPYFLCVTGVMYNIFGVPRSIILNSEGAEYDMWFVHDQESYGAKWLGDYAEKQHQKIYTADWGAGTRVLKSHGMLPKEFIDSMSFLEHKKINGYIYLRYPNVVNATLVSKTGEVYNMSDYSDIFIGMNEIYDNGGSEVYV